HRGRDPQPSGSARLQHHGQPEGGVGLQVAAPRNADPQAALLHDDGRCGRCRRSHRGAEGRLAGGPPAAGILLSPNFLDQPATRRPVQRLPQSARQLPALAGREFFCLDIIDFTPPGRGLRTRYQRETEWYRPTGLLLTETDNNVDYLLPRNTMLPLTRSEIH